MKQMKYLHRPAAGVVLFRFRGRTIGRLPPETSAGFAAAYDRLLAEVMAGQHGKTPGSAGRPRGAMLKPQAVILRAETIDGRKRYRPPMIGWVIDQWLASDYFYPADCAVPHHTYRESTQVGYRYALAVIRDQPVIESSTEALGEINLTKFNPRAANLYIETVRRRYGAATASTHKKLLSKLWRFAAKLPELEIADMFNPMREVEDPYKVVQPHLPWPLDVQERFRAICSENYLLVFLMALNTGQRISDIETMKWSQFDGTHLHVTASIKTGVPSSRRVPADLLALLTKRKREATAITIVTNRMGRPFARGCIWAQFAIYLRQIGAPQYTTHGLRKTAAQLLAEEGASVEEIMVLGGWKTEAMARYYVQLAANKRIAARADDRMDAALDRQAAEAAAKKRIFAVK